MNCFLHPEIPATTVLNVPCAEGGKLHLCEECASPDRRFETFHAFQKMNVKNIAAHMGITTADGVLFLDGYQLRDGEARMYAAQAGFRSVEDYVKALS